jgi:hypothetical protein
VHICLPTPQVNNCYNPLVGKVTGALSTIITPSNITGCIPQAAFYPLFTQFIARYPSIQVSTQKGRHSRGEVHVLLVAESTQQACHPRLHSSLPSRGPLPFCWHRQLPLASVLFHVQSQDVLQRPLQR